MSERPGHRLSGLLARYDGSVLRPPDAAAALEGRQATLIEPLRHWCLDGAGPGCSALWRPFSPPTIAQRLRIGALAGDVVRAAHLANHLSLVLDGSLRLAERGSAGRVVLKLQTKLHDARWWRPLRASDPWDCGWLQGGAADLQAFRPRRPTLMVAQDLSEPQLQTLRERQSDYAHAVRLLVVGREPHGLLTEEPASRWAL
jgi:hypothetical protein